MKFMALIFLFVCSTVNPLVLRRVINMSKYNDLHMTVVRKGYVDFFEEIKPQNSLMMRVDIPVSLKVPHVFDGELSYVPALERCNFLISILIGANVLYICETSLIPPGKFNPVRGIWIGTEKGCRLLHEINTELDSETYELIVGDLNVVRFLHFMF